MSTALVPAPAPPVLPALFAPTPTASRRLWEFFTTQISNDNTRKAYFNAVRTFPPGASRGRSASWARSNPMHVAAYLKVLQKQELSAPTIKQHLAALRMLFDWLVVGQVIPLDPDA